MTRAIVKEIYLKVLCRSNWKKENQKKQTEILEAERIGIEWLK